MDRQFLLSRGARKPLVALAAALLTAAALAANPVISGPSIGKTATAAEFAGTGFAPNAAITVMVRSPDGSSAGYSAVVGAGGEFRFNWTPSRTGVYTLTVTDSAGTTLASASVAVLS